MAYLGDFTVGTTIRFIFSTFDGTGGPVTFLSGAVTVYKDGSTTQSSTGVTLTIDYDGVTGQHLVAIDTTADTAFYTAGSDYNVVVSAGSVNGITQVGHILNSFSLENRTLASATGTILPAGTGVVSTGGGDTFGQAWRAVKAHCPIAPPALIQFWVQKAWESIEDRRPWSWLRTQTEFTVNDAKTGTCNVTKGSTSVSGGTLAYSATDVGRQFRVDFGTIYTITAATSGAYTLDMPYASSSTTGASGKVMDAYLTMPQNFRRFISVVDLPNAFQLRHWITEEELSRWDPQRSSTGTPWCLASHRYSSYQPTRVQYELWPHATSFKTYPCLYIKRSEAFVDDDEAVPDIIGVDPVINLVLSRAAEWPGTEDRRNPYYDLNLAKYLGQKAEEDLNTAELKDEELYMTWLETVSWTRLPWSPLDSKFLQNHDAYGQTWPM